MNSLLGPNPIQVITLLGVLSLLPIIIITTTSFIKISMVLLLTRESLGVQQIPPNMVIYCLSLILTFYIMGPIYNNASASMLSSMSNNTITAASLVDSFNSASQGLRGFLTKHSSIDNQTFFYQALKQFWTPDMMVNVKKNDLIILVPSFMVSELSQAFKIGFLIYLPSVIIDIIVSNILMAMGMMMMSPVTISLPIKLLLFISINGWARLISALLGSYH